MARLELPRCEKELTLAAACSALKGAPRSDSPRMGPCVENCVVTSPKSDEPVRMPRRNSTDLCQNARLYGPAGFECRPT